MRIVMIGTGYVGLVTGACFAAWEHRVTCVDKDAAKVIGLRTGLMPVYEPGLAGLVAEQVTAGRLSFEIELAPAVATADAAFIAVGTPPRAGDGEADLSAVFAVAAEIGRAVVRPLVVVTKSTVPVGTGDRVERILRNQTSKATVSVASNPEFLREGSAIGDFMKPDRVVIGVESPRAAEVLAEIYAPAAAAGAPVQLTSRRSAELIKYAANAFLATKITFINEMADLCERTGADVAEVSRGMGLDARIGRAFLNPGPGYGGSCFPKDTLALLRTVQDHGINLRLVEGTVAANAARKRALALRVIAACSGSVEGLRIAVLGLAFKADTDDMRDSPALPLIETLQASGADVAAHVPEAMEHARGRLRGVTFHEDPYACLAGADAAVIVTEWKCFRELDLQRVRASLKSPIIVDLRNLIDPVEAARHGLKIINIGGSGRQASERSQATATRDAA